MGEPNPQEYANLLLQIIERANTVGAQSELITELKRWVISLPERLAPKPDPAPPRGPTSVASTAPAV